MEIDFIGIYFVCKTTRAHIKESGTIKYTKTHTNKPVGILGTLPLVLGLAAAGGFLDAVPGGL